MSQQRIADHIRKWLHLPTLPTPDGVLYPQHDGDTAQLAELSDRLFATAAAHHSAPQFLAAGELQRQAIHAMGMTASQLLELQRPWPDPIADLLAQWPARIVVEVVS